MNLFDMKTIIVSFVISNAVCTLVMTSLWLRNRNRFMGLGLWLADFAMQFTAILLVALRGVIPEVFSIVVSNVLVITGTILLYIGLERFAGKRTSQVHNYCFLGIFIFVHAYFTFVQPSLLIRTINLSVGIIFVCSQCAWLLIYRADAEMKRIARGVGFIFLAFCLFSIARILTDLVVSPGNDFFRSGAFEALGILAIQMLFILLTFGLLLMVNTRLIADLERDVTKRQQTEAVLRQRDEELREAQRISHIGSWYWDAKTDVTTGSDELLRIYGFDPATQAMPDFKEQRGRCYPVKDWERINAAVQGTLETGRGYELEVKAFRNGKPIWVTTCSEVVRDASRQVIGLRGTVQDITERKQAEEALRTSEEKFFKAFHASPDAILITRLRDGQLMEVNEGFLRLTGYTVEEALTSSSLKLGLWVDPQDREAFVSALREKHKVQDQEYDFRAKSGKILTCLCSSEIIQLGDEAHALSVIHEITERKQAQENLRRFELLAQHSRDILLFMRREDGHILEANAAATQAYGYSREELLELTIREIRAPDTLGPTAEQMAQADTDGILFETIHRRKDGSTFPVEVSSQGATLGGVRTLISIIRDITERKNAEQEIESLSRFPTENPNPVLRVQNDGKLIYANAASQELLQMWGCETGSFLPRDWQDLIRAAVESGSNKVVEVTGIREIYSIMLVPVSGGGYVNLYGSNITGHKQMEETLRVSKEQYRAVVDSALDAIIVSDPTGAGRILSVNPAACRLFGYDAEEFSGLRREDILDVSDPNLATLLAQREQYGRTTAELTYKRKDGTCFSGDLSAAYFQDKNGEHRSVAIIRDVTERKHAEEKVQRNEAMLRSVLDQMPSGVTVRDAQTGALILSNTRSREIMGTLVDSASQFAEYRGFHPDGRSYRTEEWPLFRSIATGEVVHAEEIAYERSNGTRIALSINSAPVRDTRGRIFLGVGVFDDITERKHAEEALNRITEDLRRSNAELEQFAYVASHDLQEPLRMVSSYVQLLRKRYQGRLDQDADEFIAYAVDGATRMHNLINDLLVYSRVGTRGKPLISTSCEEVLEEAIANLQLAIEESGAAITHEPLPQVKGDHTQLIQLFQNLLSNAIKFRSPELPRIHIGARQEGKEWVFSVRDNGIGIDPKFAERIFVIFQRLHDRASYPGTGIGLAICKRIIQRHGGRIWVESQPGQGAAFYFTIPVKEAS